MEKFSLEEEVRCDYLVTRETKELWAVLLDLFDQLKRLCEQHYITYYAGAGTLLGAVRHHGFIPWDDDMDFYMPYEDYVRFRDIASKELKEPYCFSCWKTDGLKPEMSRIRRSDTTGCTEAEYHEADSGNNLGIFIDIFPLMNVQPNPMVQKIQKKVLKTIRYLERCIHLRNRQKNAKLKGKPFELKQKNKVLFCGCLGKLFGGEKRLGALYERVCQWSRKPTKQVGMTSFRPYRKKTTFERAWFEAEAVEMPFEDRVMPCPPGYEKILECRYGDWHKFEKGASQHSYLYLDPKTPYKELLKEIY